MSKTLPCVFIKLRYFEMFYLIICYIIISFEHILIVFVQPLKFNCQQFKKYTLLSFEHRCLGLILPELRKEQLFTTRKIIFYNFSIWVCATILPMSAYLGVRKYCITFLDFLFSY